MKKYFLVTMAVAVAAVLSSCTKTETISRDYKVTVIFNALEGTFPDGSQTLDTVITAGQDIVAPTAVPTREGHIFAGWCVDSECLTPVTFPVPVNSDKVYYARWAAEGSLWRVTNMTIEYYYTNGRNGENSYSVPNWIYDFTYAYNEKGYVDSISLVSQGESGGGAHMDMAFNDDGVIRVMGDTVGQYKMQDGRFTEFSFRNSWEKYDYQFFNMEYDANGYLTGFEETQKLKTASGADSTAWWASLWDFSVSDKSYKGYKVWADYSRDSVKSDTTSLAYIEYYDSDIRNTSGITVFSPAYVFFGWYEYFESDSAYLPLFAIGTSPFFGNVSEFIPRIFTGRGQYYKYESPEQQRENVYPVGNGWSYNLIMNDDYTEIDSATGNIIRLGYYSGTSLHVMKFRYEPYVPSN